MRRRYSAAEFRELIHRIYAAMPHGKVHPFVQVSNVANTSYAEVQGVVMPGRQIMGGVELVLRKR